MTDGGPAGGVLSDGEIEARCVGREAPLISNFEPSQLRPAAYNVRVADDGLVTPDGVVYRAGERSIDGPIVLQPGDTAKLSSHETFHLPEGVAGNITIKTDLARQGLLLLSGLLIDPGYKPSALGDGRLHFYVANVSSDLIVILPSVTAIAAVQFLYVTGSPSNARKAVDPPTAATRGDRARSLGFISQLQHVQGTQAQLELDVYRTRQATEYVILLGVFLVAAAVLGITLESILSIGANDTLQGALERFVPDESGGKWLLGAVSVSVAWSLYALAILAKARAHLDRAQGLSGVAERRLEALQDLRLKRDRPVLWALVAAVPVASLLGYLIDTTGVGTDFWPIWPTAVALACGGAFELARRWRKPLNLAAIERRIFELDRATTEQVE